VPAEVARLRDARPKRGGRARRSPGPTPGTAASLRILCWVGLRCPARPDRGSSSAGSRGRPRMPGSTPPTGIRQSPRQRSRLHFEQPRREPVSPPRVDQRRVLRHRSWHGSAPIRIGPGTPGKLTSPCGAVTLPQAGRHAHHAGDLAWVSQHADFGRRGTQREELGQSEVTWPAE
jgi:hypothetical protein